MRDYSALVHSIAATSGPLLLRMQSLCDVVWHRLHHAGVSWVGFYFVHPDQPVDRRLILGPRRDKPACSPIGMHGVCGRAVTSASVQIVSDVRTLGPSYVACDPRDQSEIVIPLFDDRANVCAVLDIDSWNLAAFDEHDALGFAQLLSAARLNIINADELHVARSHSASSAHA